MEKTINLTGRIDTTNSNKIEKEIMDEIKGFDGDLILDASNLEYISSAGLRVILKIKKSNDNLKIINCNSEIYEIFDMTGFVDIVNISKKYKKISVTGCNVIGEGANGVVYRLNEDKIVKVFKEKDCLPTIKHEREMAKKAFIMQIPTAISYDIVQVNDSYGTVYELLKAKSYAELIQEEYPIDNLVKDSVQILNKIHSINIPETNLPSRKKKFLSKAKNCAKVLNKDVGEKLIKLYEDLPETNTLLHGDYHIKNLMMQNKETLLIDMESLSVGHPIFEFAGIYSTYKGFSCVKKDNSATFLGIKNNQCDEFLDGTFKYYFKNKDEKDIEDIKRKAKIISYTHILNRNLSNTDKNDIYKIPTIEFCKNYINENIKYIDSLSYLD